MIAYYLKKIRTICHTKWLQYRLRLSHSDGILEGPLSKNASFNHHIVLAFWDGSLVHLGDQLFYLGLIAALQNTPIQVTVIGPTRLSPLFELFGANTLSIKDPHIAIPDGALVLSKFDMLPQVLSQLGSSHFFMGMNYWKMKGNKRVCALIADATLTRLKALGVNTAFQLPTHLLLPSIKCKLHEDVIKMLDAAQPNSLVLYNDVVASNYIEARKQTGLIKEWADELTDRGFRLLYIGAPNEMKSHPAENTVVEADWRDKVPPLELFAVLQHSAVVVVLSFDTFIAHAATLTGKAAYVVSRTVKKAKKNEERLMPMFERQATQILEIRK